MKCPKCPSVLSPTSADRVDLNFCPDCRGSWFDKDDPAFLSELRDDFPNPPEPPPAQATGFVCPRCDSKMEELAFSPLQELRLNRCPACRGVWLDKVEWRKVEKIAEGFDTPKSKVIRAAQKLKARGMARARLRP